ncbi:MAG: hypothetical protein VSS52_000020, partial [Thiotrichaceae bacterium]|nr:hypothetical protein [Thiotrichaceae bacterium]
VVSAVAFEELIEYFLYPEVKDAPFSWSRGSQEGSPIQWDTEEPQPSFDKVYPLHKEGFVPIKFGNYIPKALFKYLEPISLSITLYGDKSSVKRINIDMGGTEGGLIAYHEQYLAKKMNIQYLDIQPILCRMIGAAGNGNVINIVKIKGTDRNALIETGWSCGASNCFSELNIFLANVAKQIEFFEQEDSASEYWRYTPFLPKSDCVKEYRRRYFDGDFASDLTKDKYNADINNHSLGIIF